MNTNKRPVNSRVSAVFIQRRGGNCSAEVYRGGSLATYKNISQSSFARLMAFRPRPMGDELYIECQPEISQSSAAIDNIISGKIKLSNQTKSVLRVFIEYAVESGGNFPTIREVAEEVDLAISTVSYHINKLREIGLITRRPMSSDKRRNQYFKIAGIDVVVSPDLLRMVK